MKLTVKRKLDSTLGTPILFCINWLARIAGFILRRNRSVLPVHKIALLKFQGMGSVLIAHPSIKIIKDRFPNCHIIFIGTPTTVSIAQRMIEIDEVFTFNDSNIFTSIFSVFRLFLFCFKNSIDWAFDLEVYSKLSSVLLTLTLARNRVGFAIETVQLRSGINTQLVFFNRYLYLGNSYLNLISCLVGNFDNNNYLREYFTDRNREWMPTSGNTSLPLDSAQEIRDYIVINPQCGPLASERKWPFENWKKLIEKIIECKLAHRVAIIGFGKTEIDENLFFDRLPGVVNWTGKLNLDQLRVCLNGAKALLSGDSFNLHYGLSIGTPVLGLFGPTSPKTYFPINLRTNSICLTLNLHCSPCVHHWDPPPCNGLNHCMRAISIDKVFESLKILIYDKNHWQQNETVLEMEFVDPRPNPCLVYSRLGAEPK